MQKGWILLILIVLLIAPALHSERKGDFVKVIVQEKESKGIRRAVNVDPDINVERRYSKGYSAEVSVEKLRQMEQDPNIIVYEDKIRHTFLDQSVPIIGGYNATRLILN